MDKILCDGCKYHIFDYVWGEHKCKFRSRRIYDPTEMKSCKHFEKGPGVTPKEEEHDAD